MKGVKAQALFVLGMLSAQSIYWRSTLSFRKTARWWNFGTDLTTCNQYKRAVVSLLMSSRYVQLYVAMYLLCGRYVYMYFFLRERSATLNVWFHQCSSVQGWWWASTKRLMLLVLVSVTKLPLSSECVALHRRKPQYKSTYVFNIWLIT